MITPTPLQDWFARLDCWRHLPAYQLERRVDALFAVYLPGLVEEVTGHAVDLIIPEFPLKKSANFQSTKVDFALFAADRQHVYFLELKTDQQSLREAQDFSLEQAVAEGFRPLLAGLVQIACKSKAYQKYYHLLHALAQAGFVELPADVARYVYPVPRPGLARQLQAARITLLDPAVALLYVQPRADGQRDRISFDRMAAYVERFNDELSRTFAAHLRRWQAPADSMPPG